MHQNRDRTDDGDDDKENNPPTASWNHNHNRPGPYIGGGGGGGGDQRRARTVGQRRRQTRFVTRVPPRPLAPRFAGRRHGVSRETLFRRLSVGNYVRRPLFPVDRLWVPHGPVTDSDDSDPDSSDIGIGIGSSDFESDSDIDISSSSDDSDSDDSDSDDSSESDAATIHQGRPQSYKRRRLLRNHSSSAQPSPLLSLSIPDLPFSEKESNKENGNGRDCELHQAIHSGQTADFIKWKLDSKDWDPEGYEDEFGRTALMVALCLQRFELLPSLVAAGADVHRNTRDCGTPLAYAIGQLHGLAAVWLIEHGGSTLERDFQKSHQQSLESINRDPQFYQALALKDFNRLHFFLDEPQSCFTYTVRGRLPLYLAAKTGHLDVVQWMFRHYKDHPNFWAAHKGRTAMHGAAKRDHVHIVEWLNTYTHLSLSDQDRRKNEPYRYAGPKTLRWMLTKVNHLASVSRSDLVWFFNHISITTHDPPICSYLDLRGADICNTVLDLLVQAYRSGYSADLGIDLGENPQLNPDVVKHFLNNIQGEICNRSPSMTIRLSDMPPSVYNAVIRFNQARGEAMQKKLSEKSGSSSKRKTHSSSLAEEKPEEKADPVVEQVCLCPFPSLLSITVDFVCTACRNLTTRSVRTTYLLQLESMLPEEVYKRIAMQCYPHVG